MCSDGRVADLWAAPKGESMTPGIFETVFPRQSLEDSLRAAAAAGFSAVQFHPPSAGIDMRIAAPERATIARIDRASRDSGIRIAAIDGVYNMAHPDASVRAAGHDALARTIALAAALETPYVTLCTGTRDVGSMWRFHPENASDAAWRDMVASVAAAVEIAAANGVTLLVEPEPANVASSAQKARALLDEIQSDSLQIVLDPANIVLSDRTRTPLAVLTESIEILGPNIALAHAKDLSAVNEFCAAGTGIVPWADYWRLLAGIGFGGDVIFHTLTEADAPRALAIWPRSA